MEAKTGSEGEWTDLPKELLESIGKRVLDDSPIDLLRFRSVCTSWRSSTSSLSSFLLHGDAWPTPPHQPPGLSLTLPFRGSPQVVFATTTVCRLQLILNVSIDPNNNSSSSSGGSGGGVKGWLTKVGLSPQGKFRLLHPLSNHRIVFSPLKLHLSNVRFIPLSKSFSLVYYTKRAFPVVGVNKVVPFPPPSLSSSFKPHGADFGIIAIFHRGKLGYLKDGDPDWTLLDDINFIYDDIIQYRGQYYVVDQWGTVSWIDSCSLKVRQYSPPLYGCGGRKNLVESCGELYVVDRYLDGERSAWDGSTDDYLFFNRSRRRKCEPETVDFRVHRLDEEWGRWVHVKSLGERVFVLCNDCSFSASAEDFVGGRGNCIYFRDDDDHPGGALSSESIRVFQLEDGSIENLAMLPLHNELFWPPSYYPIKLDSPLRQ